MMRRTTRGRPPKGFNVPQARIVELCTHCPLSICRGTGDALCRVRIESKRNGRAASVERAEHRRQQQADRAAGRGYWPEIHGTD